MKKMMMTFMFMMGVTFLTQEMQAARLVFQTRAHGKDCEKERGLCISVELSLSEISNILALLVPKAGWVADGTIDGHSLVLTTVGLGTPWGGDDFVVDGDVKLPDAVASALGYKSVTIKAGTYMLDFSKNKLGDVRLNVMTN